MPDARRILNALLWLAAFFFACGIFLGATQLLRGVPPTPPVAVGRVTVEGASKLRDYLAVLLFFLIVPAALVLLAVLVIIVSRRLRMVPRAALAV